ncbi:MAG: class I SAM-dependent methyltransferase [Bacilli bacterium]|nr:class I SAM-dependent methyltransferase [Bacilli bacterium]
MTLSNEWKDYEIIDTSNGEKLERWNNIYLLRPDPQIIWDNGKLIENYDNINAVYYRSNKGGGHWENLKATPAEWQVNYKNLTFNIKQMGFKHTGLFPEQAANWDFMIDKIKKSGRDIKVLNLFAYTGGASVACLSAGASVVHVDSSRGMVDWAKENVKSSGLEDRPIRYLVDDVVKFVKREIRRGNKYDAIVMDPPSYGRGSNGEVWDIEKDLFNLVNLCTEILSDDPLFFIINSYTTGLSKEVLVNVLKLTVGKIYNGDIYSDEIGLPIKNSDLVLPCGIYGRFEKKD